MGKKFLCLLFVVLVSCSLFAYSFDSDIRHESMSLTGIADASSASSFFRNPAGLYLYDKASELVIATGISEGTYLKTEFTGGKVSFSLNINNFMKNENDLQRDFVFNANAAAGVGYFGFGMGIVGGSSMEQVNISGSLYENLFTKYTRMEESQFVSIRSGVVYRYGNFTFGFLADNILSYSGNAQHLSLDKAFDYVSGGIYWAQDKYAKRGRLNEFVFSAGAEFRNMFNGKTRNIGVGGEAMLQLTNNYSASLRGGISIPLNHNDKVEFTTGVGARLDRFDIGAYVIIAEKSTVHFNISFIK